MLILSIICINIYRWDKQHIKSIISSDGKGYYAYLPSLFINSDINKLQENSTYTNKLNNRNFIKYSAGTSLLISPFFFSAYIYSSVFNYATDGYSEPFQKMVSIAALFYVFLGLYYLFKLLKHLNVSYFNSLIAITVIFFGTNLFYYTIMECSMSHVYSFSVICCFAYSIKQFFISKKTKYVYLSSFLLALIVLIRPVNAIVIMLIPFLAGSWNELKETTAYLFYKKRKHLIICGIVFILLILIQPLLWYLQTGTFILHSYKDEGFYFLKPEIINVLFSFRKGLFIYTPIAFISLLGFYFLFKKNRFQFYFLFLFAVILTYLISAWWCWYYGDSFGHRAFIDFYFIVCLLIALLLENLHSRLTKSILLCVLTLMLSLNLIQSYQYYSKIIHPFSMDAHKYCYVFLNCSKNYEEILGGNRDIEPYSNKPRQLIFSTKNDFEKEYPYWENGNVKSDESLSDAGDKFCDYEGNEFGVTLRINNDTAFYNSRKIYVEASLKRLEIESNSSSNALFVIEVKNSNSELQYYNTFRINDYPDNNPKTWREFDYSFEIPVPKSPDYQIAIYIWNMKKQDFIIDDFNLNFYRII
jgi:hypothetical protein